MVASERRQLTLLFCDVVNSTGLARRLDEYFQELMRSVHDVWRDAIESDYGGHVEQLEGDGCLAYFGYPVAHEDDAVRAVRAAMRILENIKKKVNEGIAKELQKRAQGSEPLEVHVRIGLHTGTGVVGDRPSPLGEPANLAKRIQEAATTGAVLVSAATRELIAGHFELHSLGALPLKGFDPTELFRVVGPTGARTKLEAAARGKLTPYVGREAERAKLAATWSEVKAGADRVVVIRGEPGIGKSRMVHHFRHLMIDEGARVLECFCSELGGATALGPVIEMVNRGVVERAEGKTTPEAKLAALGSLVDEHPQLGPDALPLMAALLSIEGADEGPIHDLSPAHRRTRTLEIMHAWIGSSAERMPVALLFEDVHWSDPSTLEFLSRLIEHPPGGGTLLCLTTRPEFSIPWQEPDVRTIDLTRLTPGEAESMAIHLADGHSLPPLLVKGIVERSERVPFFVEELTKAVLEAGALRIDGGSVGSNVLDQVLPATVKELLVARFDRLGPSKNVARFGAAIGRQFSYPLIRAVAGLPDDELREHLDRLTRSELVDCKGEPPTSVYTFRHALVQEAIYGTLAKRGRTPEHERIFATLRENFPEVVEEQPDLAAHHADKAGRPDEAVPLLLEAGKRAIRRTALHEAVGHLRKGLELAKGLPEPDRANKQLELEAAIGPAYMATNGWASTEVAESSQRLRKLALDKGDGQRLFQAMWSLWTVEFLRGRLAPALDLAQQVLGMADVAGDPMLRVTGHHAVGYTHFYRGEYSEALRHAQAGLSLYDLDREKLIASIFQFSSSCALWCFQAEAQQVLGMAKEAAESIKSLRKVLSDLRHAPSNAYSLSMQCFYFHAQGNVDEVHRLATEARDLSGDEGFTLWVHVADIFLAWASARRGGDTIDAIKKIKQAKAAYDQTLTHITEIELTSMFAETLLLANRPHEVAPSVEAALRITRAGTIGHYEPELFRLQAEAARTTGNSDRAASLYRAAIDGARRVEAKMLELRSTAAMDGDSR
jgi:class 3 adenylate cyclase/tetratricopeptide (TPR) repeat protein